MRGIRFYRICFALSLAVVLLRAYPAAADTIFTYDNFATSSGTTFDSSLWNPTVNPFKNSAPPSHPLFKVVANDGSFTGGQADMLRVAGWGGATYPGGYIQTASSPFGTSFGAAVNFANFSYTGSTPQSGDNSKSPSVSIMIGDFGGTNPYFLVSRAYGASGDVMAWREYSGDGSSVMGKGYVDYTGTSGSLVVTAQNVSGSNWSVNLGYFDSNDPSTFGSSEFHSLLLTPFMTTFNGDPLIRIGANGGSQSDGSLSANIGGLYYANVSSVPLPGALLLFGPGLLGLAAIRRRFRK